MAAVLARGTTVIDNVAREPEIIDLCQMLVAMGARIDGVSTSTLVIEGVERLHPVEHSTVTDRIVTGTWVFATAIAGGGLHIDGGVAHHLDIVLDKLVSAGAEIEPDDRLHGGHRPTAGLLRRRRRCPTRASRPTSSRSRWRWPRSRQGTAMITENVFEARFMFAQELARLGADLRTDGHHAVVRGVPCSPALRSSPTTSAPVPRWCSPAWPRRARRWWPSRSTSTAATRGSPSRSRAVGADVDRLPD